MRNCILSRVPYGLILGDKEVEDEILSVRNRDTSNQSSMDLESFVEKLKLEIYSKNIECEI